MGEVDEQFKKLRMANQKLGAKKAKKFRNKLANAVKTAKDDSSKIEKELETIGYKFASEANKGSKADLEVLHEYIAELTNTGGKLQRCQTRLKNFRKKANKLGFMGVVNTCQAEIEVVEGLLTNYEKVITDYQNVVNDLRG